MSAPDELAVKVLEALDSDPVAWSQSEDPELAKAFDATQKIEALFELLRRPADLQIGREDQGLRPGQKLAEFTILRCLASGGMGQVFLARQESLGRLIALKVCKPQVAQDPRLKARFETEGQALGKLSHPNVVPVLSTGQDQGHLYLAMEYVPGPNLADILEALRNSSPDFPASRVIAEVLQGSRLGQQGTPPKEGPAKLDRAYQLWVTQVLQQVAQGLAAAHEAGILHRDIKPANIVFGLNKTPKIVDFGLARTTAGPSVTVAGQFYGTPAYTSPEQARGDSAAVCPASDVFSFGVMLFECLSLKRPFAGRTSIDVITAILGEEPHSLREVDKRIPWELEAITDKCLRKDPSQRYHSGKPLAEDLQNFLELRPISAKRPSPFRKLANHIKRKRWVAGFFITLIAATVLKSVGEVPEGKSR